MGIDINIYSYLTLLLTKSLAKNILLIYSFILRNLKASNILIDVTGKLKLSDPLIFQLNFSTISLIRSRFSAPEDSFYPPPHKFFLAIVLYNAN
jgi:hypothetical protein